MNFDLRYQKGKQSVPQSSIGLYRETSKHDSSGGIALPPTYGIVKKVYKNSTADVELTGGAQLFGIAVMPKIYVTQDNNNVYGGRFLPPIGAQVLIEFPDGIIQNAIITGSRFSRISKDQDSALLQENVEIEHIIDPSGLITKIDHKDGITTITDKDNSDFIILIDKKNSKIKVEDWSQNIITMDSNGVEIDDANGNTMKMDSNGVEIDDANSNVFKMESGKITINNFEALQ